MRKILLVVLVLAFGCGDPGEPSDAPAADVEEGVDTADTADTMESDAVDSGEDEPDVPMGTEGLIPGRLCPNDNETTFDNTGRPFLRIWCLSCHSADVPPAQRQGAPVGVNFDTSEEIERHVARIYLRSADGNTTMPPEDVISEEERVRLGDWITCGMPGLDAAE